MNTLRKVFGLCAVFLLLFLAACGGGAPAATESPLYEYEAPAATEASAEEWTYAFPSSTQTSGNNEPYVLRRLWSQSIHRY